MIALDSNTMTYWIDTMGSVPDPPAEPLQCEKVALARIFLWLPEGCFHYTPTVEREYQEIKSAPTVACRALSPIPPAARRHADKDS